jgi:hypothetical protein
MTAIKTCHLFQIAPEENDGETKENLIEKYERKTVLNIDKAYKAVIECISNPQPECSLGKEGIFLPKDIKLRIPIQYSRGHKLIEDTNDKRRQNSENNIV